MRPTDPRGNLRLLLAGGVALWLGAASCLPVLLHARWWPAAGIVAAGGLWGCAATFAAARRLVRSRQ